MAHIRVSTVVDASVAEVWAALADIKSHTEWMVDARAITFTSDQREGIGTSFDCETRIGPFRLTDTMTITVWAPEQTMGVVHTGLVTGTGRFTLQPAGPGRTEVQWEETLEFPVWMGGPVRDAVGGRVLEALWRHNLKRLKRTVEAMRSKRDTMDTP